MVEVSDSQKGATRFQQMEEVSDSQKGATRFTLETFTLWSHQLLLRSPFWFTPSCKDFNPDLPVEAFTLVKQVLEFSSVTFTLVGADAPCTKSVYKAAYRSFLSLSQPPVSHKQVKADFSQGNRKPSRSRFTEFFFRFYDFLARSSPTPELRQRMTLSGFSSKGLTKLAHALKGNYSCWQVPTPKGRSSSWKSSFSLPNCVIILSYSFYERSNLWVRYYRRGLTYELDTNRNASSRLCGLLLRSVASLRGRAGKPLDILPKFQSKLEVQAFTMDSPGSAQDISGLSSQRLHLR